MTERPFAPSARFPPTPAGHHLALFGRPAFTEPIVAGGDGPAIDVHDDPTATHTPGAVDQTVLNVILLVAGRYSRLTAGDLGRLTRAEAPWQATQPGQPIHHRELDQFFTGDGAQETVDPHLNDPAHVARLRKAVRKVAAAGPADPDDLQQLLAEVTSRAHR